MKKNNKINSKLQLKIQKLVQLTPTQMQYLGAGDDTSLVTKPASFNCPAPYNVPPLLTAKYCV